MNLKPCPFCGGEPRHINDNLGTYFVECSKCGANGPVAARDEHYASRFWNLALRKEPNGEQEGE